MGVRATDIRKGQVIQKDGDLLLVTDFEHKTPGNLRAIINIKTKSLTTGSTSSMRLGSSDVLEVAFLDRKKAEYLYRESSGSYVFMDTQSYDQFMLSPDEAGDVAGYLREGLEGIRSVVFNDRVISIDLPNQVSLQVVDTAPPMKGATEAAQTKPATLETGLVIQVPAYLESGELVLVDTREARFVSRAKG